MLQHYRALCEDKSIPTSAGFHLSLRRASPKFYLHPFVSAATARSYAKAAAGEEFVFFSDEASCRCASHSFFSSRCGCRRGFYLCVFVRGRFVVGDMCAPEMNQQLFGVMFHVRWVTQSPFGNGDGTAATKSGDAVAESLFGARKSN